MRTGMELGATESRVDVRVKLLANGSAVRFHMPRTIVDKVSKRRGRQRPVYAAVARSLEQGVQLTLSTKRERGAHRVRVENARIAWAKFKSDAVTKRDGATQPVVVSARFKAEDDSVVLSLPRLGEDKLPNE